MLHSTSVHFQGTYVAIGLIFCGPQLQLNNAIKLFIKLWIFNQCEIIIDIISLQQMMLIRTENICLFTNTLL